MKFVSVQLIYTKNLYKFINYLLIPIDKVGIKDYNVENLRKGART